MTEIKIHIHPALAELQTFMETLETMRMTSTGNAVMLKALCERMEIVEAVIALRTGKETSE